MKPSKNEHKFSRKERGRVYQEKKQSVPVKADVPKTRSARKQLIRDAYKTFKQTVYCPALKSDVVINKSISSDKTRSRAAEDAKSTQLALVVPKLLEIAELIYTASPKPNSGQSSFDKMYILVAAVKGVGYAKITVGKYKKGMENIKAPYCQYCVSHITLRMLKNKEKKEKRAR